MQQYSVFVTLYSQCPIFTVLNFACFVVIDFQFLVCIGICGLQLFTPNVGRNSLIYFNTSIVPFREISCTRVITCTTPQPIMGIVTLNGSAIILP